MTNEKDDIDIKDMYGKECTLKKDEFIKKYNVNINGLSTQKVKKNIFTSPVNPRETNLELTVKKSNIQTDC